MEAYKIGVTLALTNQVSGALGAIARQFAATNKEAVALQSSLKQIKMLGFGGAIAGAAGFLGLDAIKGAVKPAMEYAHQLSLMNVAGMKQKEIAEATAAAWKTTGAVQTTTATENLQAIREMRMVFGDTADAVKFLPQMQKIQAVLDNVLGEKGAGGGKDVAFAAAKALELRGASKTPEAFQEQADLLTRGVIASGGKVTPQQILQAVKYGGVAASGFSNSFMYGILPTLVQELGGSGTGTALTSMNQAIIGGVMSQRSLKMWEELGLVDKSKEIFTKTGSLKGIERGGIVGGDMYQRDPLEYVNKVLIPALISHGHTEESDQQAIIARMFGNRTAARIANIMVTQGSRLQKDFDLIGQAGTSASYDQMIKNDPVMAQKAAGQQWENLKTVIGIEVIPVLIPAIHALTGALQGMVTWAREHPILTQALTLVFTALSGLAVVGGGVMLVSAGLMLFAPAIAYTAGIIGITIGTMTGVGLALAALVLGASVVANKWPEIKAGLVNAWHGVADWFSSLANVVGNGLTKLWERIKSVLPSWLGGSPTGSGYAPTPGARGGDIHITTTLDSNPIAHQVFNRMGQAINKPRSQGSGHDNGLNMPTPAFAQ